ncbi:MAG: response regulator, partial [Calditrichaeota bacterium]|nr:response regulator [Calditrichota bacterium]
MTGNGNQTASPRKILIVDDEMSVHRLLTAYLKKYNYIVENCLDSQEIVQKVRSFEPDLILLDLMMPALDGVSATKRIRNLRLSSYLPIIMLTA